MNTTHILIFDVGLGQSIFVYPEADPSYGMMVDCGNVQGFEPIDYLLKQKLLPNATLKNLTLTNFDQDHFSGLPYLRSKVSVATAHFASNLSSSEIKDLKPKPHTNALLHTCEVKDTYIHPAQNYSPPYTTQIFHLQKSDLESHDTNNLSQVVFIEHNGTVICISGDLEAKGWKALLLKQPAVKTWLAKTSIFIASHHGRDNGYCADVFAHCKPECIIISDKDIMHDTQENMSTRYGGHVVGTGVVFNGNAMTRRKVLTTRNDGHLYVQLAANGARVYSSFAHS